MKTVPPAADDQSLRELLMLTAREAYADWRSSRPASVISATGVDRRIGPSAARTRSSTTLLSGRCETLHAGRRRTRRRCRSRPGANVRVVLSPVSRVDIAERRRGAFPGLVEGDDTGRVGPARYRVRMVMDADAFENDRRRLSRNVLNTDGDHEYKKISWDAGRASGSRVSGPTDQTLRKSSSNTPDGRGGRQHYSSWHRRSPRISRRRGRGETRGRARTRCHLRVRWASREAYMRAADESRSRSPGQNSREMGRLNVVIRLND